MNISILALAVIFVIALVIRLIQNHSTRKTLKNNKKLLDTQDLINVLFNVGLFTGGTAALLVSFGYGTLFFGEGLSYTQPIINFFSGVLFMWFSLRNIYYGGKI